MTATVAFIVVLMVLKKATGGVLEGIWSPWIIAGFIACILGGQILTHYTRLKFIGWVTTIIGVGFAGFWLYSLFPKMPAFTTPNIPAWSAMTWFAVCATLLTMFVLSYGAIKIVQEGSGTASKWVTYAFITFTILGALGYFALGPKKFQEAITGYQKQLQEKAIGMANSNALSTSTSEPTAKDGLPIIDGSKQKNALTIDMGTTKYVHVVGTIKVANYKDYCLDIGPEGAFTIESLGTNGRLFAITPISGKDTLATIESLFKTSCDAFNQANQKDLEDGS